MSRNRRRKERISESVLQAHQTLVANRAAHIGLDPDQLPEQKSEAPCKPAHPAANCLDRSLLDNPAILADIVRALDCPMCEAEVRLHHERHQEVKHRLKLDFKPSVFWVRKLAEALKEAGLEADPEARMEEIRTLKGAQVVRYIESRAYTSRSSNTECFVLIDCGEFWKPFRAIFDGSLLIPDTPMGQEVHKILAKEFLEWLWNPSGFTQIGHRVLDRLEIVNQSAFGHVKLEAAIPWPIHC